MTTPTTKKSNQQRNWLELPSEITVNILQRIDVVDILENAQKVCTAWREICKAPYMWTIIHMDITSGPYEIIGWRDMFEHVVDKSQGQLVDLTMIGFCDNAILHYVAVRSRKLKRLHIVWSSGAHDTMLNEPLKKLSLLEELSLVGVDFLKEDIETAGRYCPKLKILQVEHHTFRSKYVIDDEIALAVGENLHELTHLELIRNEMSNKGLEAILDGCCHLNKLNLLWCLNVGLTGKLEIRCLQQIKNLTYPLDPFEGHEICDGCDNNSPLDPFEDYEICDGCDNNSG